MTEQAQVRRYAGSDAGTPSTDLIPPAPPWRVFDRSAASEPDPFRTTEAMVDAVNAALTLRRPLLLTGRPGSGKSSLIESVARQLDLGPVLRWPITSRSTVDDALYRYDAMGRLYAERLNDGEPTAISDYLRLGPLGTALLPNSRPRALLIDEIDKGDIDLPNDLLNVFERGEFEIKELARLKNQGPFEIQHADSIEYSPIAQGRVVCREFPFVVLTSNGEREFPPAFLRRCIRFRMPDPREKELTAIVTAHLGEAAVGAATDVIKTFVQRSKDPGAVATDQLMNAIYLVTAQAPDEQERRRIVDLVLAKLNSDNA
ncbi:AAA family ATPase [Nocardia sp. CA-119907]|uniref:AAA family ATPase n=1 Tax=Nocardia sp. CA-119907 TaxID=3239973 RepID=UPI003D972777